MGKKVSINDHIQRIKDRSVDLDANTLFDRIQKRDSIALGQAITLLESTNPSKRKIGKDILDKCAHSIGQSKRIGITGVPGVGKSTFIEAFGLKLIDSGYKVAVLAIDPSSQRTGGSILGDKTRMEQLSVHNDAFVRPSPAGSELGGVAARTRETMLLCEAAGYDYIIVETVGVGQSETAVSGMVDFFLLLMLAGAGDELQGIKRGIMELADYILINKSDGANVERAKKARLQYKQAVHLFPPRENGWVTHVDTCSATQNDGMDEAYQRIETFFKDCAEFVSENRKLQQLIWMDEAVSDLLSVRFLGNAATQEAITALKKTVLAGEISPPGAADKIYELALKHAQIR